MKCPECGAENSLVFREYYQVAAVHQIGHDGKILGTDYEEKHQPDGRESLCCNKCGAYWTSEGLVDTFGIDRDGKIYFEED